ncbi:sensor histidine kinase [Cohnella sp. GCM10027633]|uniref:sensor histidine kinase n=1 Tax=unclassified Cohnella TaxID=2636738 RepID=UPI003639F99C
MRSLRLQTKLFINYSIVVIAIIAVAFGFFYSYMARSIERNARDNLNQLAVKTSEQLDGFLSELDHLALQTVTNKVIQSAFIHARQSDDSVTGNYFDQHLEDQHNVMDMLASINGPNLTAMRFSLFNAKGDYLNYGTSLVDESVIAARMFTSDFMNDYQTLLSYQGNRIIAPPHYDYWSDQTDTEIISIYREIRDVYESYGMLEIQQPYSKLESIVQFSTFPQVRVYVYDEKRNIIYGTGDRQQAEYTVNGAIDRKSAMKNEIMAASRSEYSGWTVMLLDKSGSSLPGIQVLRKTLVLTGISLMAITLSVIYLITRQMIRPLKQLTASIKKVSLHNLSVDVANDHNSNEIVQLNRAFDKMFDRLKHSMDQVVESRSHELNAQFRALQSQMNPHFLYNVLSVISAAGMEAGVMRIMEMCHKLSNMLRYITTYQDREVTIQEELTYARHYLELMKERYQDHFTYALDVQDEAHSIPIPKLMLQPLIENCFQHAFVTLPPPWHVDVVIGLDAGHWFMQVKDNGSGFDREMLEGLIRKTEQFSGNMSAGMSELQLGGLGLHHTVVRLKLLYDRDMIFRVEANEPHGSIITIGGLRHDPGIGGGRRNADSE